MISSWGYLWDMFGDITITESVLTCYKSILCSFVVGSDGYVYECRGWNLRPDMEGRNWSDFPDMVAEDFYGESMSSKSLFIGFFEPPDGKL